MAKISETRTVKTVRVFLASSKELRNDRVNFADLMERLQNQYESRGYTFLLKKWEYLNPAYNKRRKQDEYNDVIKQCDVFMALFYSKAGEYTVEEFDEAIKESKKREFPLLIYFKDLKGEKEPAKLKKLKKRISDELEHFWGTYETTAELHLEFVLWLDNFLFGGRSELKVDNGEVTMGDVKVAEMSQLPFAINNKEYQQLEERIKQLDIEIEQARENIKNDPDDPQYPAILSQKLAERNDKQQEFDVQQEALLGAAKQITEMRKQQVSKKLQEAMDAFKAGQLKKANTILEGLKKEGEQLMAEVETKLEQMHEYIDALKLQTETVMAETETPIEERIARVAEIHAQADDWANRSAYDKKKYAKLLYDYGQFLYNYGRYIEAEKVYLRQIALSEELYGKDSTDTATSYNNIGLVYWKLGEYDKALEYYFKALKIKEKVLGIEHTSTATTYNNIGTVYDDKGEYDKALEYHLKALAIREKVLGADHPSTATCYNNIGAVYDSQSEYEKALEFYFKALEINEKVLGTEHPSTSTCYNNIGSVYYSQDKYEEALEYLKKALDIREKKLGHNHPSTILTRENIEVVNRAKQ